jgi:AcrR family transcriptional regulator
MNRKPYKLKKFLKELKIMADDIEIRDRILTRSEEMFLQFGYSKVTMDEIASHLGMSKKTLYKFFPSKEVLIKEVVYKMRCGVKDYVDSLISDNEMDFVEKLKRMMNLIGKQTSKLRGPLLEDLRKNIPDVWQEINEFRKENVRQKFTQLINMGVEKGIFRKDIDQQMIVLIYSSSVQGLINPEVLSQLPFTANQIFESVIKVIFSGIFTEEGRTKYNSYQIEDHVKENNNKWLSENI